MDSVRLLRLQEFIGKKMTDNRNHIKWYQMEVIKLSIRLKNNYFMKGLEISTIYYTSMNTTDQKSIHNLGTLFENNIS